MSRISCGHNIFNFAFVKVNKMFDVQNVDYSDNYY